MGREPSTTFADAWFVARINSKVLIAKPRQGIPGAEHGRKRGAPARPNWRSARQHAEIGKADLGASTRRSKPSRRSRAGCRVLPRSAFVARLSARVQKSSPAVASCTWAFFRRPWCRAGRSPAIRRVRRQADRRAEDPSTGRAAAAVSPTGRRLCFRAASPSASSL
jgi:hypothetical protein